MTSDAPITVTPRHILVGDKVKATLEKNMQPRADEMQGKLILPVDAALKKEVEKLKYIAERNPSAPFMHEVSIIGDRKIPYEVLSSVLYTAGQNELENFRFVVISSAEQ